MIKIYKKTNKTISNNYGCKEIKTVNELNKTIMISISGQDNYEKAVFGIIREAAHAARIFTTQEIAAGFDIDKVPVDFIGYTYEKEKNSSSNHKELVEKLILPFLKQRGVNYQSLLKQARQINLFVFDKGATIYKKAEAELYKELMKENFKEEEVQEILSQIALVATGTKEDLSKLYATNIVFIDLKDELLLNKELKECGKVMAEKKLFSMYNPNGNNSIVYPFIGFGAHDIREYLHNRCPAKTAISSITSYILHNSIFNSQNKRITKLTREELYEPLYNFGANLRPLPELLRQLDRELTYGRTKKYTCEEATLRIELDKACKAILKYKLIIKNREKEKQEVSDKINTLIQNIKEYSSETTYYQILSKSNLWITKDDIFKEKSDKQIRKEFDKKNKTEHKKTTKKAN